MIGGLLALALVLGASAGVLALVGAGGDGEKPAAAREEGTNRPREEGRRDEQPRAWLGIQAGAAEEGGVAVLHVIADSPADEAGLERGDRILAVDGEEVDSPEELRSAIAGRSPGDEVTLRVVKAGDDEADTVDVRVTLAERPALPGLRDPIAEAFDRFLGGSFRYLDEDGNTVEVEAVPGRITAISDDEITIDVNGDEGERTFDLPDDYKAPAELGEGDRAVVVLKNGSVEAVIPGGFGLGPLLPGFLPLPYPFEAPEFAPELPPVVPPFETPPPEDTGPEA